MLLGGQLDGEIRFLVAVHGHFLEDAFTGLAMSLQVIGQLHGYVKMRFRHKVPVGLQLDMVLSDD